MSEQEDRQTFCGNCSHASEAHVTQGCIVEDCPCKKPDWAILMAEVERLRLALHRASRHRVCDCADWAPGLAKLDGPIITAQARNPHLTATPAFQFIPFRYCPWCGGVVRSMEKPDDTLAP